MDTPSSSSPVKESASANPEKTAKSTPPPMRAASEYPSRPSSQSARPTSFSTDLEPQKSRLGLYITIGVVAVLIILLIFQVFSKSGLSAEVRQLQKDNEALAEQVTTLQATQTTTKTTQAETSTNVSYYPAMYRNSIRQQIAELITIPSTVKISSVLLQGNGGMGENAELAIYETSDPTSIKDSQRPSTSKLFNASKIPANQRFAVQLDKPFELKSGKSYLFVIRPSSTNAQANIGFVPTTNGATGAMWVYAMKVNQNGQPLSTSPSWQAIPTSNMILDLKNE